jgi:hypothetical protein
MQTKISCDQLSQLWDLLPTITANSIECLSDCDQIRQLIADIRFVRTSDKIPGSIIVLPKTNLMEILKALSKAEAIELEAEIEPKKILWFSFLFQWKKMLERIGANQLRVQSLVAA